MKQNCTHITANKIKMETPKPKPSADASVLSVSSVRAKQKRQTNLFYMFASFYYIIEA